MKITKSQLKKLIFESDRQRRERHIDVLDKEHQNKYGKPLTKHQRAYSTEPTVELDPAYLTGGQDTYDLGAPTFQEFEAVRLLVLQNHKNIENLKRGFESLADDIDKLG